MHTLRLLFLNVYKLLYLRNYLFFLGQVEAESVPCQTSSRRHIYSHFTKISGRLRKVELILGSRREKLIQSYIIYRNKSVPLRENTLWDRLKEIRSEYDFVTFTL